MIYLFLLAVGLVAIFWLFDQLEMQNYRKGVAKFGPDFQPKRDLMKIGYFVMFAYFALLSMAFSGTMGGSSEHYDPCGSSMRC